MPEITQVLGFEASGAISQINELKTALGGLNTKLRAFNKASQASTPTKVIQGFNQVTKTAEKAATAVTGVQGKLKDMGTQGSKHVQSVTLAWGGLVKAMVARTVVQAITTVIGALKNATDTAAEFQITVARISNIAEGPAGSIEALTESVSGLSVSLGRDISEVSEAAFEALQNDLGTTTQTMDLLKGAANNLALVTGGTLTQSVNSISSVIKSFGIDISKSNEIADTFFQAIDSGRITLEEFQSSLGRVAPIAGVLGVKFEETAASIAAITQAGTTARVAQTQLRNVLQKMLDPTDKLKDAFRQLGFATGKELIAATGGLIPALQKVSTIAAVGTQEFADFFGTIRGNLGSINLLINEAEIVTRIMGEMEVKAGRAAEAMANIDKTTARNVEKSVAKLSETMRKLGDILLEVKSAVLSTFNFFISGSDDAVIALTALGLTVGALAIAATSAAIAFAPITAAIIAIGVGGGAAIIAMKRLIDALRGTKPSAEEAAEYMKKFNDEQKEVASAKIAEQFKRSQESQTAAVKAFTDDASQRYQKLGGDIKQAQNEIVQAMQSTLKNFVKSTEKTVKDIKDSLNSLIKQAKDYKKQADDIAEAIKQQEFEKTLKTMSKQQQVNARLLATEKARLEVKKAAAAIDGTKEAKDAFERAQKTLKLNQRNLDTASKGNAFNEREALSEGLKTSKAIEKAVRNAQKISADLAIKQNARVQSEVLKSVAANNKAKELDKELDVSGPDSAASKKLKSEFEDIIDSIDVDKLPEKIATDMARTIQNVKDNLTSLEVKFKGAAASLQEALDANGPFAAAVKFGLKLGATGNEATDKKLAEVDKSVKDPGERLSQKLKITQDFLKAQREIVIQEKKQGDEIVNTVAELEKKKLAFRDSVKSLNPFSDSMAEGIAVFKQINELQKEAVSLDNQNTGIKADELRKQIELSTTFNTTQKAAATAALDALDQTITKQQNLNNLRTGENAPDPEAVNRAKGNIGEGLDDIAGQDFTNVDGLAESTEKIKTSTKDSAANSAKIQEAMNLLAPNMLSTATSAGTMATNAGTANTNVGGIATSMGGVVRQTDAATQAMGRLEQAAGRTLAKAKAAAAAVASGGGGSKYHGGQVIYRNNGGPVRGQDTRLAALSDGEMVTNAKNSRKFFTELQAINAGQSPPQRDKGGPVTNIGDININVSQQSSDTSLPRDIASELRRELRRQTSIL